MKELPNLEQKYAELFDTIKLLQEENQLLKEALKYSSMIELSQNKIKDIPSDTNNKNTNTNDMFEDTPNTKSKKEHDSPIKELIEKYEKQIKFRNIVIAKQNEEFKEKLKNSKNYDEKTDKKK